MPEPKVVKAKMPPAVTVRASSLKKQLSPAGPVLEVLEKLRGRKLAEVDEDTRRQAGLIDMPPASTAPLTEANEADTAEQPEAGGD